MADQPVFDCRVRVDEWEGGAPDHGRDIGDVASPELEHPGQHRRHLLTRIVTGPSSPVTTSRLNPPATPALTFSVCISSSGMTDAWHPTAVAQRSRRRQGRSRRSLSSLLVSLISCARRVASLGGTSSFAGLRRPARNCPRRRRGPRPGRRRRGVHRNGQDRFRGRCAASRRLSRLLARHGSGNVKVPVLPGTMGLLRVHGSPSGKAPLG
jgi:hypothetical protein